MNKDRRKILAGHCETIRELRVEIETFAKTMGDKLDLEREGLADTRDDEQEYLDNMPEGLANGEKGSVAEQAISALESAVDAIQSMIEAFDEMDDSLGQAIDYIETARE